MDSGRCRSMPPSGWRSADCARCPGACCPVPWPTRWLTGAPGSGHDRTARRACRAYPRTDCRRPAPRPNGHPAGLRRHHRASRALPVGVAASKPGGGEQAPAAGRRDVADPERPGRRWRRSDGRQPGGDLFRPGRLQGPRLRRICRERAGRRSGPDHLQRPRPVSRVFRDPGFRHPFWGDRHLSGDPAPASPDPSPPAEENLNRAFGIVLTVELFPLHAFGARYDLPAPLYLFLIGAGAVVFVSFLLVLRRPVTRLRPTGDDVPPVPPVPSWPGWLLFMFALVMIFGGLFGTQSTPDNIVVTA